MKAVVLTGGQGTRLRPFTHATQKQLLPVANKPVLEYVLEDISSAGIEDISLVIGGSHPEKVREHFADGFEDVDLTFIHQGEPLGLAHAVDCARDFVGDDRFLVYFGDTIIDRGIIQDIVGRFDATRNDALIPFQKVDNPSRFGIGEFDGGDLVRVHEKPTNPPSDLAYVGAVAFTPTLFEQIKSLEPSDRGELELTDAIDHLVQERNVSWREVSGLWKDVGTPPDLLDANSIKLEGIEPRIAGEIDEDVEIEGSVRIAKDSVVEEGCKIIGPAIIGEGVTITANSHIGPYTSIGDRSHIEEASLKECIVMSDSTIKINKNIDNSIIGSKVEITNTGKQTLVGSDSTIQL